MKIDILAFGIAKDILNGTQLQLDLPEGSTIGSLKTELVRLYPDFDRLQSLRIALNAEYQNDETLISEHDEVVIIPPVSGG